jgi:hypothetical protein
MEEGLFAVVVGGVTKKAGVTMGEANAFVETWNDLHRFQPSKAVVRPMVWAVV